MMISSRPMRPSEIVAAAVRENEENLLCVADRIRLARAALKAWDNLPMTPLFADTIRNLMHCWKCNGEPICTRCNGIGSFPDSPMVCPDCRGQGTGYCDECENEGGPE